VGDTVTFTFDVVNQGAGETRADTWYDRIVLSVNNTCGDDDDIILGGFKREGTLGVAGAYPVNISRLLVRSTVGTFYVFAQTDTGEEIYEGPGESNNAVAFPQFLVVEGVDPVNLTVEDVVVPATAQSGFGIDVTWTGRNSGGGGINGDPGWRDGVYLSADTLLDKKRDIFLGFALFEDPSPGTPGLETDETYTPTHRFPLPVGVAGQYYVMLAADQKSEVDESDELDNTGVSPARVDISLSPPCGSGPPGYLFSGGRGDGWGEFHF